MIAAAVGWFPGAIMFPLLLGWFAGKDLPPQDSLHLFVSFLIAGMIATTYSYAIVLYIVVCHGYRACWQTASRYRDRVRYELFGSQRRIRRVAILAGVLPLAAAALLLAVEIPGLERPRWAEEATRIDESMSQLSDLLKLVIGLIISGALGLYAIEKSADRMIRTVRALTLADD